MSSYTDIANQCTVCGRLFAPQADGSSICEWHPNDPGIPPNHPKHASAIRKAKEALGKTLDDAVKHVQEADACGNKDDLKFALGKMVDVIRNNPALWKYTYDALLFAQGQRQFVTRAPSTTSGWENFKTEDLMGNG